MRSRSTAQRAFAAAVVAAALSSCARSSKKPELQQPAAPVSGLDYFPLAEGGRWEYASRTTLGSGPEESERKEYTVTAVTAPDGGPGFEIELAGRGLLNRIAMTYGVRDGAVVTWLGVFGAAKTEFSPPLVELPASLGAGASWSWRGTSRAVPMAVESRLDGIEALTVPAGRFDCLRVSRTLPRGGSVVHWYASGVGLVRMQISRPGGGALPSSSEVMELTSYTGR